MSDILLVFSDYIYPASNRDSAAQEQDLWRFPPFPDIIILSLSDITEQLCAARRVEPQVRHRETHQLQPPSVSMFVPPSVLLLAVLSPLLSLSLSLSLRRSVAPPRPPCAFPAALIGGETARTAQARSTHPFPDRSHHSVTQTKVELTVWLTPRCCFHGELQGETHFYFMNTLTLVCVVLFQLGVLNDLKVQYVRILV